MAFRGFGDSVRQVADDVGVVEGADDMVEGIGAARCHFAELIAGEQGVAPFLLREPAVAVAVAEGKELLFSRGAEPLAIRLEALAFFGVEALVVVAVIGLHDEVMGNQRNRQARRKAVEVLLGRAGGTGCWRAPSGSRHAVDVAGPASFRRSVRGSAPVDGRRGGRDASAAGATVVRLSPFCPAQPTVSVAIQAEQEGLNPALDEPLSVAPDGADFIRLQSVVAIEVIAVEQQLANDHAAGDLFAVELRRSEESAEGIVCGGEGGSDFRNRACWLATLSPAIGGRRFAALQGQGCQKRCEYQQGRETESEPHIKKNPAQRAGFVKEWRASRQASLLVLRRAALGDIGRDGTLVDLDHDVGGHLKEHGILLHGADDAVKAAGGDHLVALLEAVLALLHLLLLLARRANDEEVEDDGEQNEGQQHVEEAAFLPRLVGGGGAGGGLKGTRLHLVRGGGRGRSRSRRGGGGSCRGRGGGGGGGRGSGRGAGRGCGLGEDDGGVHGMSFAWYREMKLRLKAAN